MKKTTRKRLVRFIINGAGSFICCSVVLGVSMLIFFHGLNMTEEMIKHRLLLTLSNILFLSFLFTLQDMLRSWYGEKRQVKRILAGVDAITRGDFSVRIAPFHKESPFNQYDEIIDGINRMAAELESTESMKKDFISNVSHEIKTPLANISAYCEILQDPTLSEEERNERFSMVLKSVRNLSSLVSNILKLNKLENQEISSHRREFDLSARVADVFLSFVDECEEKGIGLSAEIKDDVIVSSDPDLLDIVWNNLMANAVKFTPKGGTISVTLRENEKSVEVAVRDSGCGIAPQSIPHIFERFYQGDTSHRTEGNGLGLSLVKRVMEITGSTITVESREGRGALFTVSIPLEE